MTSKQHRLALICDFLEEQWPSMDLVGDMVFEQLRLTHEAEFAAVQLRPALKRRLSSLPIAGNHRLARNADRLLSRMRDYPQWLRRQANDFDLFHIIDHSYAHLAFELDPERTVITCHDLNTFRCLLEPEKEPRPRWFRSMTQRILDGLTRCARIICVSRAVCDEVLRYKLVPAERVTVVHNGVDPSCTTLPDPVADDCAAEFLGTNGTGTPYLLHVGSTAARKRLDVLLNVFAEVLRQEPTVRLVRVGGAFTVSQMQLADKLGIRHAIQVMPYLDRRVLAAIYRRASVLVQPSDSEGFGLPVVEALACGCPVIASDLAVFHEVAGSAGTFCAVADVSAWSSAVLKVLQEQRSNPIALKQQRELAMAQAAKFSWTATVDKLAEVYRQALTESEGHNHL